jgi:hypothetical protein
MAASDLILIDGFDLYNTGNPASNRWIGASGGTGGVRAGRIGGSALAGDQFLNATISVPGAPTQFSMGFAWQATTALPGFQANLAQFKVSGATQIQVLTNVDGSLSVLRAGSTTLGSTAAVLSPNVWAYIEFECVISATVGVFNIYVNSVQVLALSGVNTKGQTASSIDQLTLFPGANVNNQLADDFYMTSVASKLGECRVETVRPSADTAQKDWTPNSGATNFSRVNEAPIDGDTSFISSSTAGQIDLYDFTDLSSAPSTIHAVQTTVIARKDDATTRTLRSKVKSSSTTANGATTALSTSYAAIRDIFVNDPNTSSAWTGSTFNAAQMGVEEVS